jgi:UDP-2,3-diacylglucosamine hydrolase
VSSARAADARSGLPAAALEPLPEVELPPGSVAIADLHLDAQRADGGAALVRFLAAAPPPGALIVLGDLFDVWVGPAQARMEGARVVLAALRALAERGTRIHVVPGNRDFLLDASFEAATGAVLHREGFVGRSGPARVLCVHGDTLCTRDTGYLRLRRVMRSGPVQWLGPRLPLWMGRALARRLRRASVQAIAAKLPDEKSVQPAAADRLARAHRADVVLCGHAHAFRDERLDCGARWVVLDAFGGERDAARFEAGPHVLAAGRSA